MPSNESAEKSANEIAENPSNESAESPSNENVEDETPLPPVKSYNLDFLDQLDDPNFNPFETKTAITDNFGESQVSCETAAGSSTAEITENKMAEEPTTESKPKEKVVAKKPAVRKPWLKKKPLKTPAKPAEDLPPTSEGEDSPLPPVKGYNLDFLSNLDDPNYNPFQTKTAITDNFGTSDPSTISISVPEKAETKPLIEDKVEEEKRTVVVEQEAVEPNNIKPMKPLLKKKSVTPAEATPLPEDDEAPLPPAKGYNLDFLSNLDDPNFNPFETKTAVKPTFDNSSPADILDQLDDPNFNPFETKTAITDNFGESKASSETAAAPTTSENTEVDNVEQKTESKPKEKVASKKPVAKKPWLKKKAAEDLPPTSEGEDSPLPPVKGYNLDFLSNLDDPNYNPFQTKTAITDNFGTSDPSTISISVPEKAETKPLIEDKVEEEKRTVVVEQEAVEPNNIKPMKPLLKKKSVTPAEATPLPEDDEAPLPPAKGYNLDFLSNLDDPNFNPFETKTAVKPTFDNSSPADNPPIQIQKSTESEEKSANQSCEERVEQEVMDIPEVEDLAPVVCEDDNQELRPKKSHLTGIKESACLIKRESTLDFEANEIQERLNKSIYFLGMPCRSLFIINRSIQIYMKLWPTSSTPITLNFPLIVLFIYF